MMSGDLTGITRRLSVPSPSSFRRQSGFLSGSAAGARRLSTLVPEAVSRRLSNVSISLGLGRPHQPETVVEQGKALCALYMRSRIRTAGPFGIGVSSRAQTCVNLVTPWAGSRLVFPRLSQLGRYLERARPRLYTAIGRYGAPLLNGTTAEMDPADIVYGIGTELFKENITWGKIVSLFVVCGALASEPRGNPDLVSIIDAVATLIKGPLTPWLEEHGGWIGLTEHCQPSETITVQETPFPSSHLQLLILFLPFILLLIWFFWSPSFTQEKINALFVQS